MRFVGSDKEPWTNLTPDIGEVSGVCLNIHTNVIRFEMFVTSGVFNVIVGTHYVGIAIVGELIGLKPQILIGHDSIAYSAGKVLCEFLGVRIHNNDLALLCPQE